MTFAIPFARQTRQGVTKKEKDPILIHRVAIGSEFKSDKVAKHQVTPVHLLLLHQAADGAINPFHPAAIHPFSCCNVK